MRVHRAKVPMRGRHRRHPSIPSICSVPHHVILAISVRTGCPRSPTTTCDIAEHDVKMTSWALVAPTPTFSIANARVHATARLTARYREVLRRLRYAPERALTIIGRTTHSARLGPRSRAWHPRLYWPGGRRSDRKAWATAARSRLVRTSALLTHARRGPHLLFEHASHAAAHGTDMRKGTHMQCTAGGRGAQHEPTPLPPRAPSPHNAHMTARGAAGGTVRGS